MADFRIKRICKQCNTPRSPAVYLYGTRYLKICPVCRLKNKAAAINKDLEIELKRQEAEQLKYRRNRNRLAEIELRKQKAGQNL